MPKARYLAPWHQPDVLALSQEKGITMKLKELRKLAGDNAAVAYRDSFLKGMWDLSQFMKTLKQRFTRWFNRQHARTEILWEERGAQDETDRDLSADAKGSAKGPSSEMRSLYQGSGISKYSPTILPTEARVQGLANYPSLRPDTQIRIRLLCTNC